MNNSFEEILILDTNMVGRPFLYSFCIHFLVTMSFLFFFFEIKRSFQIKKIYIWCLVSVTK